MREWRNKLNQRLAEGIFLTAQKDYLTGDLQQQTPLSVVTNVLASVVLATPILCILAGVALIWNFFPNLLLMVIAAMFLGMGYKLWPRRTRIPSTSVGRSELPATFAIVDAVGAALGAPKVDRIVVTEAFEADILQARGLNVLGIGAYSWVSIGDDEKLAMISHEMAHLVNHDPTRGRFLGAALTTLEGWQDLFTTTRVVDDFGETVRGGKPTILGDLLFGGMRLMVELFWGLMERLSFLPQQRAEYLADAYSAEIAGKDAPISLLRRSAMQDRLSVELGKLGSYSLPKGRELIDRIANATFEMPQEERDSRLAKMRAEANSIDANYPPTVYRIKFLELLPEAAAKLSAADFDFAAADAELTPLIARIGNNLVARIQRQ